MAKIKLLEISDYYLPHWTGIVKSISYMNTAIHRWFDITVLTVAHSNKLARAETISGVRVKRSTSTFSLSRAHVSFALFKQLIREIPNNDVLFINSPSSYLLFAAALGKLYRKKVVIFHQGDLTLPLSPLNWCIERVFDISFLFSCFFADRVFCATADYAKHSRILRFFLYKFFELPILAPKPTLSSNSKPITTPTLRAVRTMKDKGNFIFGFSGRFVQEKGFDTLLLAIEKAVKINKKIRFVYAGDINISYEDFYEQSEKQLNKVRKYVTVAGLLGEKGLEEFYSLCDSVIIPSRSDCFPTVQIESLLRNIPVIVTDIPGARVPVQKTNFGLIIKPDDVDGLTKAILKMISERSRILKNASRVTSYFDLPNDTQTVKERLTF